MSKGAAVEDGHLDKDEYVMMMRALSHALNPDFDEEEFLEVAEADWKKDCGARGYLVYRELHQALFELADVWCDRSGSAEQYIYFLQKLYPLVVKPMTEEGLRLHRERRLLVAAGEASQGQPASRKAAFGLVARQEARIAQLRGSLKSRNSTAAHRAALVVELREAINARRQRREQLARRRAGVDAHGPETVTLAALSDRGAGSGAGIGWGDGSGATSAGAGAAAAPEAAFLHDYVHSTAPRVMWHSDLPPGSIFAHLTEGPAWQRTQVSGAPRIHGANDAPSPA